MRASRLLLVMISLVLGLSWMATAATYQQIPDRDTCIYSVWTESNFGSFIASYLGKSRVGDWRGLMHFNLSSIPAGSQITSAILYVRSTDCGETDVIDDRFAAYTVRSAWTEGTGWYSGDVATSGTTWTNWNNGGVAGTDYDATPLFSDAWTSRATAGFKVFTYTIPASTVSAWVNNSSANQGLIFIGTQEGAGIGECIGVFTREAAADIRPYLVVEYNPATAAPVFSPAVATPGQITMSCDTPNASIYYTIDGTTPTTGSMLYTGPVMVSDGTTLKAIAVAAGLIPSAVTSQTYTIPTATYQQVSDRDTCIFSAWPNSNMGGFIATYISNGYRGLLHFDLSSIPAGSQITSAVLRVRSTWVGPTDIINTHFSAYMVKSAWTEGTGGYSPDPATTGTTWANWNNGGVAGTDYEAAPLFSDAWTNPAVHGYQLFSYTIPTNTVATWVNDPSANQGIILIGTQESAGVVMGIYSREALYPAAPDLQQPCLLVGYKPSPPAPVFSPNIKYVSGPKPIAISAATGASIYYTTDGTTPTVASFLYTSPVTVTGGTTLKAIAVASGMVPSSVTSQTYTIPAFDTPAEIQFGSVTVDGNLSDWAGATWTSLNQYYDPLEDPQAASDVTDASYAVKWSADKVYVAVKVQDTAHKLLDSYTNWYGRDAIEIYLHTTGNAGADYPRCEAAQQYSIGVKANGADVWAVLGNGEMYPNVLSILSGAEYCVAKGHAEGDWLYYEVAMTPYEFLGVVRSTPSIVSPLAVGDVIGVDVCVVSNDGTDAPGVGDFIGYMGMKSSNLKTYKAGNWENIGLHKLTRIPGDANGDGAVDVGDLGILAANYGGTGKTWSQGDFNGDTLVDVGDLGILAAHYGEGSTQQMSFSDDYAKAFGTTVSDDTEDDSTIDGSVCSALGLPLIAGLMLAGLMLLGSSKFEE
jgi:hypothetical protein